MVRKKSYMPTRDDDFFNFQGNLVNQVVANAVTWGIPPATVADLVAQRTAYEPLYLKSQDKGNRTQGDVKRHRQARQAYQKYLETFVNSWLRYNAAVPDDKMTEMKMPRRDMEPSPHPVITDTPYVALRTIGVGEIEARVRTTRDQTRPSMLSSANLVEYRYTILEVGDIPPADAEDYPKKDVSSRAKFIITLNTKNTGKKFWTVFRWVNTTKPKQEGPWTDAINITIA